MASDLDKFKRRLIRSVARLLAEKVPEDELWEKLAKESGCDCKLLWKRMRVLTLKKLKRLLAAEDKPENVAAVARMSRTDWLLVDLVLVHESHDFIGLDKLATSKTEYRPMMELFSLVQRYHLEESPGDVEKWAAATKSYNSKGRVCSPMVLQRRWYLLKEAARSSFYSLWMNYRGNNKLWLHCQQFVPTRLQMAVAKQYPHVITQPFPTWEELIEKKLVILPEQFEARVKKGRVAPTPSSVSTAIESDIVLVEPEIETIDLGVDSDSEEKQEQNPTENQQNPDEEMQAEDWSQNEDSNSMSGHSSNVQASNSSVQQTYIPAADYEESQNSFAAHNSDTYGLEPNVTIKTEPEEENCLSNVKILTASHVPPEAHNSLNTHVIDTVSYDATNVVQVKQEHEDHRTLDVNNRAENINRFLLTTENLLRDDELSTDNNVPVETDAIKAQKARDYLKTSSKDIIVDETDALIAQKATEYIKFIDCDKVIDKQDATTAEIAKYSSEPDIHTISDETDDIIAEKVNDYIKQNLKTVVEEKVEDKRSDLVTTEGHKLTSVVEIEAPHVKKSCKEINNTPDVPTKTLISSNDEDTDNMDDLIKEKADHFFNKQNSQVKVNVDDDKSSKEQTYLEVEVEANTVISEETDDIEMDPIIFKMNPSETHIEFIDDGIVVEDDDGENLKEPFQLPCPIEEKPINKKEEIDEEEELGEYVPQTFDLKLIMTPVIFCIKLDEMPAFQGKVLQYTIRRKEQIDKIIQLNKPILKNIVKKLEPVSYEPIEQEESHEHDDLFHKPARDSNAKTVEIKEDKTENIITNNTQNPYSNEAKLEIVIEKEDNNYKNDDHFDSSSCYSDYQSECGSESIGISDDQKVKATSYLLQKPRNRSYNPIQLCKNPDFNTRLKRLPVGFFASMRNRQLLKSCKPMTVDLHKAFEHKLVNGTLYLKASELAAASQSVVPQDVNSVSAVVPSAMPVQSLIDNTVSDMFRSEITSVVIDIDDDDDKPLASLNTNMKHLVDKTINELLPSESNSHTNLNTNKSEKIQDTKLAEVSVQNKELDDVNNAVTSLLKCNEKIDEVTERNKTINLPDISKVREINQRLLTAQVPPIMVKPISVPKQEPNPVGAQYDNSGSGDVKDGGVPPSDDVDWRRRPRPRLLHKQMSFLPKLRLDPSTKEHVPWNKRKIRPNNSKLDDFLLTVDTLNKMINKINGLDTDGKSCKQKKNWTIAAETPVYKPPPNPKNKQTAKPKSKQTQQQNEINDKTTVKTQKKKRERIYRNPCCWVKYRNVRMRLKQRVCKPHPCKTQCICCCTLEAVSHDSDEPILLDDEDALDNACKSIEAVVQQTRNRPHSALKTHPTVTRACENSGHDSIKFCECRGKPMTVENVTSGQAIENNATDILNQVSDVQTASLMLPQVTPKITITSKIKPINTKTLLAPKVDASVSANAQFSENSLIPSISICASNGTEPSQSNPTTDNDMEVIPQHNIIVSFPDLQATQRSENFPDAPILQVMPTINTCNSSKVPIHRKPYITIMPRNDASYIDVNKKRLVLKNSPKEKEIIHHVGVSQASQEKPIHLGKNKILLTTVKFPPEIRTGNATEESQQHAKVIPTLPLPPGVQLVLMPSGQLTYVTDPTIQLQPDQLSTLPTLMSLIQQQLNAPGTSDFQNLTLPTPPLLCNEVIKLSDDEEYNETSPSATQKIVEKEPVESVETFEHATNVVDTSGTITKNTTIVSDHTDSETTLVKETQTFTNFERDDIASKINESNFGTISTATEISKENTVEMDHKETCVTGHVEVTESQKGQLDEENCTETNEKTNIEETNKSVEDNNKSVEDNNKSVGETNKSTGRNLLSDLMEMSGISEEDVQHTSQDTMPQPQLTYANTIVVDPNINLPTPDTNTTHLNITNDSISQIGNITDVINPENSIINLPELTPVTSLAELRYACENEGKFFKLDLETGAISSIVVCIKKTKKSKNKSNITVDLTLDDESETPVINNPIDRGIDLKLRKGVAMDANILNPRPVKLIKAIRPRHHVSLLKRSSIPNKVTPIRQQFSKKSKRKEHQQARIEANINLADCEEPMEEEYLEDDILETDYTIVYNSASASLNSSREIEQDDDDSSDDEPLAVKAKRIKLSEPLKTSVVSKSGVEGGTDNTLVLASSSDELTTIPVASEIQGLIETEPISAMEDINVDLPVEAMDVDDALDNDNNDCILGV